MSCRGPWEVLALQHIPEGTSLSSSGRSLPWPPHTELFFPGRALGDPAPATILAHNCLSGAEVRSKRMYAEPCRSQRCGSQQTWGQAQLLEMPCPPLVKNPCSLQVCLRSLALRALPTMHGVSVSVGGFLGLTQHLSLLCIQLSCSPPSRLPSLSLRSHGLSSRPDLQRWSQHAASSLTVLSRHLGDFLAPAH